MKARLRYLVGGLVTTAVAAAGIVVAPSAAADCSYSGNATVCAQGDVRGGGGGGIIDGGGGIGPR